MQPHKEDDLQKPGENLKTTAICQPTKQCQPQPYILTKPPDLGQTQKPKDTIKIRTRVQELKNKTTENPQPHEFSPSKKIKLETLKTSTVGGEGGVKTLIEKWGGVRKSEPGKQQKLTNFPPAKPEAKKKIFIFFKFFLFFRFCRWIVHQFFVVPQVHFF